MSDLKDKIQAAVEQLAREKGYPSEIYHPELGCIVRNGKATHALIAFFKKLERKTAKGAQSEEDAVKAELKSKGYTG